MNASCKRCQEQLLDHLYGELDAALQPAFEAHLAGCAPCQAEASRLGATRALMEQIPLAAPTRGIEAILQSAERAVRLRETRSSGWLAALGGWLRVHPLGVTAALAATVTLLVVSIDLDEEQARLVPPVGGALAKEETPAPSTLPMAAAENEATATRPDLKRATAAAVPKFAADEDQSVAMARTGGVLRPEALGGRGPRSGGGEDLARVSRTLGGAEGRAESPESIATAQGAPAQTPRLDSTQTRKNRALRKRAREQQANAPATPAPMEEKVLALRGAGAGVGSAAPGSISDSPRRADIDTKDRLASGKGRAPLKARPEARVRSTATPSAKDQAAPPPAPAAFRSSAPSPTKLRASKKKARRKPADKRPAAQPVIAEDTEAEAISDAGAASGDQTTGREADARDVVSASERAGRRSPVARRQAQKADLLRTQLDQAGELVQASRCHEALPILDAILREGDTPWRAEAYLYRGTCRSQLGNESDARSDFALAATLEAGRWSRKARRALRRMERSELMLDEAAEAGEAAKAAPPPQAVPTAQ